MKPREYVKKYNLKKGQKFNHNNFVTDLTLDFMTMIEFYKTTTNWNYTIFKNIVKQIRQKFDSINAKTGDVIPEGTWKYFYATVIVKISPPDAL